MLNGKAKMKFYMGEKEGGGLGMALINVSFVFSIKKVHEQLCTEMYLFLKKYLNGITELVNPLRSDFICFSLFQM